MNVQIAAEMIAENDGKLPITSSSFKDLSGTMVWKFDRVAIVSHEGNFTPLPYYIKTPVEAFDYLQKLEYMYQIGSSHGQREGKRKICEMLASHIPQDDN